MNKWVGLFCKNNLPKERVAWIWPAGYSLPTSEPKKQTLLLLVTAEAGEQKHQKPTPSSLVRQHPEFVGTCLSISLTEAIHYKCQLLCLSVWKSDNKGSSFFILVTLPYSSSYVPDQHPQPFWHKGSILWKTIFSQTEGGRGMVSGWCRHITFIAHFISIITSIPPQIIRHLISETGEPCTRLTLTTKSQHMGSHPAHPGLGCCLEDTLRPPRHASL